MQWAKNILRMGLAALVALSCVTQSRPDRKTRALLEELDHYLSMREMYTAKKLDQLEAYRKLVVATPDPARRYELGILTAAEYFPFSFDSTQYYLKQCQDLALQLEDRDRYLQASIELGHLYEKAGNYLEATQILYDQIDTLTLPDHLQEAYYWTLYDFSKDMAGNSGMVERLSIPPAASFRQRLLDMLPQDSERYRSLLRDKFMDERQYARADSVSRLLVASVKPEQRNFAIHAFFQGELANAQGNLQDQLYWLVKSAECDIVNSVRDYASLTMVAQMVLPTDVNHSFRYLRIAQEDALQYNARLRPWQISRFLMQVEDAYQERQLKTIRMNEIGLLLLGILAVILSLLAHFLIVRSRQLSRMQQELSESNASLAQANTALNGLNQQISRENKVKEQYILNFLQGLAAQISAVRTEDNRFRNLLKQGKADQLLKELSISGRSEKAREEFYDTFDNTFLALYPDFVEQFNALLKEEAREIPPEGHLTTEQRIFALIRLGVDDSKRIAAMLDYSLSTIYNYKVAVKNAALGDRESLEERVKQIGK